MDYQEIEEKKCRICLEANVIVDWTDYLPDHIHLTYKDCYYKYTQLNCFDGDNLYLSTMLCYNCCRNLENINAFISKAIETHNLLQQRLALNFERKHENDGDFKSNFETIIISETDTNMIPEIQNENTTEKSINKESIIEENKCSIKHMTVFKSPSKYIEENDYLNMTEDNEYSRKDEPLYEDAAEKCLNEDSSNRRKSEDDNDIKNRNPKKKGTRERISKKEELKKDNINTICPICSKVLSKYNMLKHERTHAENRERNEICTKCGMKFYDKTGLGVHMKIHMENREKTKKCEFCEKAFYTTGALNIHRRIHLGQMIKCTLCTKEYFRQVDLNKHLRSHSAAKISDDFNVKKKYFVQCEFCEVTVRSTKYKAHSARHMNQPLAKCAICEKEFFSRHSCFNHVTRVHKIGNGERSNYVIGYKTNYYSKLFLQQNVGEIFTKE